MKYLNGVQLPFKTISERRSLIGKEIIYLRDCDIDKSGRGAFFPRVMVVHRAEGLNIIDDEFSTSVTRGELVEVVERRLRNQ